MKMSRPTQVLKNAQHEHFARLLTLTIAPREAAALIGIAPQLASRLARRRDIRERVQQLEDIPALTIGQALAVAMRVFEAARQAVGNVDPLGCPNRSGAARRLATSVWPRRRKK